MQKRMSADQRREILVNSLLELAYEVGPDRLTTTEVAERAGVTQGTVFRHFKNREELWVCALTSISERLISSWERNMKENVSLPAVGRLEALVVCQLEEIQTTPALPLVLFSRELNSESARMKEIIHRTLSQFDAQLVVLIDEAGKETLLRSDLSPQDIAKFLTSLIQGLSIRWGLSDRSFDLVKEGRALTKKLIHKLM